MTIRRHCKDGSSLPTCIDVQRRGVPPGRRQWRDVIANHRDISGRPITFAVLGFEPGPALKILRQYGDADQKHPQRKDDEAPANIIATQQ
jgi:hypothetical protein